MVFIALGKILLEHGIHLWLWLCIIQGYALLCVGFPLSDLDVETQDEDEVRLLFYSDFIL